VGGIGTDVITSFDIDCGIERVYWEVKLRGASTDQKIAAFVASSDTEKRIPRYGLEALIVDSGAAVIPSLAGLLHNKQNERVLREDAARALMQIPDPDAADALIMVADDPTEEKDFRTIMLGMLAWQGHPRAVADTISVLERHDDARAVSNALYEVERLANAGVDKRLLEDTVLPFIESGTDNQRIITVNVLRTVGSQKSINPLLDLADKVQKSFANQTGTAESKSKALLQNIVTTLGMIGKDDPTKVLPFLFDHLYSADPQVRIGTATALARVGGSEIIPVLADQLKKETDQTAMSFEVSAIYVLADAKGLEALSELKPEVKDARIAELIDEAIYRLKQEGIAAV
jgi:HEAT repeat protein